ncbi:hypothetical protein GF406_20225 [candidate division KSB1 bacterium]|nr:hypothetical protein [candidate division KSB1 bacterium]
MPSIMPDGENSRKAVRWISSRIQTEGEKKLWTLINQAITRFDLNPFEAQKLIHFYKSRDES